MNKIKKTIYVEISGTLERYFNEIKKHTGMNNANSLRYCILHTWKRELEANNEDKLDQLLSRLSLEPTPMKK